MKGVQLAMNSEQFVFQKELIDMAKHNDQIIGDVLKNMVREMKISPKLYEVKVKKFWSDVMGTTINNYTTDIKIRRKKYLLPFPQPLCDKN